MRDTEKHNGWANWSTWNLALWAGNDEDMYREVCSDRPYTANDAEDMAEHLFPAAPGRIPGDGVFGTPDMDLSDWQDIDWQEIANAWNEE